MRIACLALALAVLAAASPAPAQTRRALLVGIGRYPEGAARGARGGWSSLDGAVNDVAAVRDLLVARFGFRPQDIALLTDGEATREAILQGFRRTLVDPARPGDLGVFYYAGHGSWMKNSLSREPDRRDETIVPVDGRDIRDKELARLMAEAARRSLRLTAVFDSCHSGSIARGLAQGPKVRALPPEPGADARDPDPAPSPAQEGALVVSAAQEHQGAAEALDDDRQPHGLFTAALLRVLRSAPNNADAEAVVLRTSALLRALGAAQDPVLDGPAERRRAPLFAEAGAAAQGTVVAAGRVEGGDVEILGGLALGLAPGALLARAPLPDKPEVRLRVDEVRGLSRSTARPAGPADQAVAIAPGDLFRVERWAAPARSAVRVHLGPAAPASEIRAAAAALAPLRSAPGLQWVDDPTSTPPTHVVSLGRAGWTLRFPDGREEALGARPAAGAVRARIAPPGGGPAEPARLFVRLPAPEALAARLAAFTGEGEPIAPSASEADALYLLAGRIGRGGEPEYAWVLAGALASEASASLPLPRSTAWRGGALAAPQRASASLAEVGLRLARVRAWLTLDPLSGDDEFPYRLAVREPGAPALLPRGEPLRASRVYEPALVASPSALARGSAVRYVYLLVVDSSGRVGLLFPSDGVSVGNRFPAVEPGAPLPQEIPLGEVAHFKVLPPLGADTYVLLATAEPIPAPSLLEQPGVTRGRSADPLGALLGILEARRGGSAGNAFSIDRVTLVSRP